MPFKVEETGTCVEVPYFDKIVHATGDAAVASVIQYNGVDLLRMPLEAMQKVTSRDLPDTYCAVVGSRDQSITISGNGTHAVMVPTERADEVWIVAIVGRRTSLHDASVTGLRQLPDT